MLSFFMMAGLSYLLFLLTFWDAGEMLGAYTPWLFLIFSFPHFMATYWVWISRVKAWQKEWLPLLFPVFYLLLFLVAMKGWLGDSGIETILKCSYFYLLYHFAQQLYGITLWLCGQNGIFYLDKRKLLIRLVFLSAAFYAWLEMEMRGMVNILFYHSVSSWNLHSQYIMTGFGVVFTLSLIAVLFSFYDYFKTKNVKQLMVIGPIGLAWLWFLPPMNQNMVLFLPILHGIQYIPFIKMKGSKLTPVKWVLLSVIFVGSGWFFFRWLPFHFPAKPLEGTLWPALVLTLLNNHHFFIDGRIWKLKDPENVDLLHS